MKTNIQNYDSATGFNINRGFNKIVKEIQSTESRYGRHAYKRWNIYKVIDLADGNQVLYFGGGHDDMGIGTFIFKNNQKTRNAFNSFDEHWKGGIYVEERQGNEESDYVICSVTDYKVAPYKEDRRGRADIDWRTVRSCKTLKELVHYIEDYLDCFGTSYSDKNWTGYDFCITTDLN